MSAGAMMGWGLGFEGRLTMVLGRCGATGRPEKAPL